jgi:hypothetical protein
MKRKHKCNCDGRVRDFMETYRKRWIEKQTGSEHAAESSNEDMSAARLPPIRGSGAKENRAVIAHGKGIPGKI